MGLIVQYGMRWGEVWATDDASAVAVWIPPDSGDMSFSQMLRLGFAKTPFRFGLKASLRTVQALSKTEAGMVRQPRGQSSP